MRGRQLARVSAVFEGETVWSAVYPGNAHTVHCLQPAVLATETALELAPEQRKRAVWRLDGGSGSDNQLIWLFCQSALKKQGGCAVEIIRNRAQYWENLRFWGAEVAQKW